MITKTYNQEEFIHELKEVDSAVFAVCSTPAQIVEILRHVTVKD